MAEDAASEHRPLVQIEPGEDTRMAAASPKVRVSKPSTTWAQKNQWVVLALASGACAALNGVFAKLTTTELTSSLARGLAQFFRLSAYEPAVEFVVRCTFFGLNLAFNGVMWTLFTTALARGNSTTQVSIMNTSANFVITAVLGFAIFSEALPPLWWLGAATLVAGNVIIGQKDESAIEAGVAEDPGRSEASEAPRDGASLDPHMPDRGAPKLAPEMKDDAPETETLIRETGDDAPDLGDL